MRGFWLILKTQLNVNFGLSALRYRFRREQDKVPQTVMTGLAVALAVGALIFLYSMLTLSIYTSGVRAGNPQIVLVTAILGLQLFLLVTGIFYVVGVFYYSRDLSALLPLPLKPWQVLGGKFAVVMAYEYLMALPVLLPPIVIYGVGQGAGILYWLKALLLLMVSPALPMTLASLIAIALMRFVNIGRRRDLLTIVGSTLAMVSILAVNLLTQRVAGNAGAEDLARLLADQVNFINSVSRAFPPSAWATFALAGQGLESALYLLLYVILSAALLGLMFLLADRLYYKTAMRSEEVQRRTTGKRSAAMVGGVAGPVRALFMREFHLLVRTPAYAMNCLIGSLVIPIIIPLTMLQGNQSSARILTLIQNPTNSLAVTFGSVGLMMLTALINVTASTALSREGRVFWMSRMIPVPPHRQVWAKFLVSMAVAGAGLVLTAILLVALLKVSAFQGMLALALGLIGAVPLTIVNMLPDLLKPKLNWTNPYEAVKQNLNVILAMLAGCLLLGIEVLYVLLLAFSGLPAWAVYLLAAALLAVLSAAGVKALSAAARRYYSIEA